MVLYINGAPVSSCPASTQQLFSDHPYLVSRSREFKTLPVRHVESRGCLYVAQGEYSVVPNSDVRVKVVGSEDATTCHILLFKHANGVALTHCDGSSHEGTSLKIMLEKLVQGSSDRTIDVYGIGGFLSDVKVKGSRESQKLSLKLIMMFIRLDYIFNLSLWSCCELNTIKLSMLVLKPFHYGMCYDRTLNSVFPASFKSHGPESVVRNAFNWASYKQSMTEVYDNLNHSISVLPFQNSENERFRYYCQLSDNTILSHFSTSPSAEPPDFVNKMRSVFFLLGNHPNPMQTLFPSGKCRIYVLQEDGQWKLDE